MWSGSSSRVAKRSSTALTISGSVQRASWSAIQSRLRFTSITILGLKSKRMADRRSKKTPLGSGLHGDVYLLQTGSVSVVEKVVEFGEDQQKKQAFRSEVSLLQQVNHPNIVRLLRSYIYDTKGVMFLEYANGRDIYHLLRQHGSLGEPLSARIVKSVLSALDYLHSRDIVHADIKAENVVYVPDEDRAMLLDFSLSFVGTKQNKRRFGTLFAMAPEMLGPLCDLDSKLDIWATGVLAYEMVTGNVPWCDSSSEDAPGSDKELIRQIREDGVDFPDSTSDAFVTFCKACLQKIPVKRPGASLLLAHPWLKTKQASMA